MTATTITSGSSTEISQIARQDAASEAARREDATSSSLSREPVEPRDLDASKHLSASTVLWGAVNLMLLAVLGLVSLGKKVDVLAGSALVLVGTGLALLIGALLPRAGAYGSRQAA